MLDNISPIDGRYRKETYELSPFFSEEGLIKYRLKIEIEYLIALSKVNNIAELKSLSASAKSKLRNIYIEFSTNDARKIKEIEKRTNHDVKAIEYFIDDKLKSISATELIPWIHFALTSEDVNNLAYTLIWRDSLVSSYQPQLKQLLKAIKSIAKKNKNIALLARTHGQPATPTTVGKEFAVYYQRLNRKLKQIQKQRFLGKLGGATGTWAAHVAAYPQVDWLKVTKNFIRALKLEPNLITTQIDSRDSLIESYQTISQINSILIGFCQDIWQYISREIFIQKHIGTEVGSSTMPHKINPINFENAEGNLGISNALLLHFCTKLPISRLQRDLSDSTVLRNQGVALAHSLLALKSIAKGLDRIKVNKAAISRELDKHWEVLAEAIQTVLRKNGKLDAYENLRKLTRGEAISQKNIKEFIKSLNLPKADQDYLLKLTPKTYIGLSPKLVDLV